MEAVFCKHIKDDGGFGDFMCSTLAFSMCEGPTCEGLSRDERAFCAEHLHVCACGKVLCGDCMAIHEANHRSDTFNARVDIHQQTVGGCYQA